MYPLSVSLLQEIFAYELSLLRVELNALFGAYLVEYLHVVAHTRGMESTDRPYDVLVESSSFILVGISGRTREFLLGSVEEALSPKDSGHLFLGH